MQFNYQHLISEGVAEVKPYNPFEYLDDVDIQTRGKRTFKFKYYGQVDPTTRKPSGIGMAQNASGDVAEGFFAEDVLSYPFLWTKKGETAAYFQTQQEGEEEPRCLQINFRRSRFLQAQRFATKDIKARLYRKDLFDEF